VQKTRLKLPKKVSLKKICDELWSQCIHARAHGHSELNGEPSKVLHAHHIMHKPNFRLRYDLGNGIALTPYQHKFMAHGPRQEEFRDLIIAKIGQEKFDYLKSLRGGLTKSDLNLVKIFLENKLEEFKESTYYRKGMNE
jgi:hypothetical protein